MKRPSNIFVSFLCFSFLFIGNSFAEKNKIDSLLNLIKVPDEDTFKIIQLNDLSWEFYTTGDYEKALLHANSALELSKKINYQKGIAQSYNNLGNIEDAVGKSDKALEYYFISLKIREKLSDKKGMSASYNNIGGSFRNQLNYKSAIKYYILSLKIKKEIGDKKGMSVSYNNIGNLHRTLNNNTEALKNLLASWELKKELGDQNGIANCLVSIGIIYNNQGDYARALKNHFQALKIYEDLGRKYSMSITYNNIGKAFFKQNKIEEAKKYQFLSLKIGEEIGAKELIMYAVASLSDCDSALGNWREAYNHHKYFKQLQDSILNAESSRKTAAMDANYENQKKEAKILLLEKDKEKQAAITGAESKRNRIILFSIISILFFVVVFSFFMYHRWRITNKQNRIIEFQKSEAEKASNIIREKNKDITDSINYARRIQKAILPHRRDIWAAFPNSFVLFKPKDIVSGDFYFFHKKQNLIFIAAVDCTGHGVPGAFMSMIGAEKLNDAVAKSSDTSEILMLLNQGIKSSLKQSAEDESTQDGMDIALCSFDLKKGIVNFSGANRPLWIIRNGENRVEEIKAGKVGIGGLTTLDQQFYRNEISLQKGDTIYISTDGFADQFNAETGKKVMIKKLKEILCTIQDKTMKEQGDYLNKFIETWRGGIAQVDDILIIGIRV